MIVLITGMMAAGKSTVAQAVAERLERSVHLRGDLFRKMIVSGRRDMGSTHSDEAYTQLLLRYRIAASVALQYKSAGFDVIYQDTIIGPALQEVAALFGEQLKHIVVLNPSLSAIRAREAGRPKQGYGQITVEELHDVFQTTPRIGHWIDNSELSVATTVDSVMAYLNSGADQA